MYSVIESGGLQHKIALGETLKVPKIEAQVGDEVTVSEVLLFSDDGQVNLGTPHLEGASVTLEVLSQGRHDKVVVFKHKPRKRYRRTQGHRQHFTEVLVTGMSFGESAGRVDEKARVRARARVAALAKRKQQTAKPTRAQKVAAQSAE